MHLAKAQPLPIPYTPVSSSWIKAIRWTPQQGAEMKTKGGKHSYPYPGISRQQVREWLSRVSKGKWWHKHIREAAAAQFSRWTGPVHPLFLHPQVDGPVDFGSFSKGHMLLPWLKTKLSPYTTAQHLAALFGWLPGTKLNYHYMDVDKSTGRPHTVWTEASDPNGHYTAHRSLTLKPGQPPQLHNEEIAINKQPNPYTGVSGAGLLRQIRAAYELGIPRLDFFAAWKPPIQQQVIARPSLQHMFPGVDFGQPQSPPKSYTGGLHWPLMGADGILPAHWIKRVPRHIVEAAQLASRGRFLGTQRVSDFFASPEAREYYTENPMSHDAFIDTTPGSYSRRMIEQHVSRKAMEHGHPIPIPDNMMPKRPLHLRRPQYPLHLEHLIATGELHPDHYDEYFDR